MKRFWNAFKSVIADLEFPILIFPVAVVLIVAIAFLFPSGHCAVWQWWTAVCLTIAFTLWKTKNFKRSLSITASFLFFLALVWIGANVGISTGSVDAKVYHCPAIRMMIEGWNPVWQGTFSQIERTTGISSNMLWTWHVISMPRGIWYFLAAAYGFTRAAFNLFFPLFPIIAAAVVIVLLKVFRHSSKSMRIAAALIVLAIVPKCETIVDCIVGLAAIGLLLSMYDYIRNGDFCWRRLVVFSFWMAISKQTALLHCCVFWAVFCLFNTVKRNVAGIKLSFIAGGVIVALAAIVSISPYWTSYKNYSHPLYPRYTADEIQYPTRNITFDFLDRNEDAAAMGHLGAYVNAFISHDLAKEYYKLKFGKKDFVPKNDTWEQNLGHTAGSPTKLVFRLVFTCTFLILLIFGKTPERLIVCCILSGTIAMPIEMIGFLRYTPWAMAGVLFLLPLFEERFPHQLRRHLRALCVTSAIALFMPVLLGGAILIDRGYATMRIINDGEVDVLISKNRTKFYEHNNQYLANIILLQKEVPGLRDARIVMFPYDELGDTTIEECYDFYDYSFKVLPDVDLAKYSYHERILKYKTRKDRLLAYPKLIVMSYFVTLPKSILEVIYG